MSKFNSEIEDRDASHGEVKQGHSCFGCCCDMRRAVIILSIVNIVSILFTIIFVAGLEAEAKRSDNDEIKDSLDQVEKALKGQIALVVFGFILSAAAMYGAIKYQAIPVATNAIYILIHFLASAILSLKAAKSNDDYSYGAGPFIFSLIIMCLVVYPHILFVQEVRSGILEPATYSSREKQSCCCV